MPARARLTSLAALSAALFVLGYPALGIWPLSFVFGVPLLLALQRCEGRARRVFLVGTLAGALTQLAGYAWLLPTLARFSGLPAVACAPIFVAFALYQGAAWGVASALAVHAGARGWPLPWAWVAAWTAVERFYPAIFPTPLAVSVHAVPVLVQVVDLGGPGLLSAAIAACSAAGFLLVRRRRAGAPVAGAVLALFAAILGYGMLRSPQIERSVAAAPKLSIGLVQANLGLEEKRRDQTLALHRHLAASKRLEREHAPQLIVWPETAVPAIVPLSEKDLSPLVAGLDTPVLLGALGHRTRDGRTELFNSTFLVDRGGRVLGRTDKQQLLPFAERMPFGEQLPLLYDLVPGSGQFSPGDGPQPLRLGDARLAALICYEDILPGFVRDVARATRAQLLVNLTNDAWFGDSAAPHIHLALSTLRAVEQRRFLVRATNSGVSAIVDPFGHVVAHTRTFTQETLLVHVALLSEQTLYARLGDWPSWLAALAILLALFTSRAGARAARAA